MKTIHPSDYHHNGFVATHALGHMQIMAVHHVHLTKVVINRSGRHIVFMIYVIFILHSVRPGSLITTFSHILVIYLYFHM